MSVSRVLEMIRAQCEHEEAFNRESAIPEVLVLEQIQAGGNVGVGSDGGPGRAAGFPGE
jgi:hypothetical protein